MFARELRVNAFFSSSVAPLASSTSSIDAGQTSRISYASLGHNGRNGEERRLKGEYGFKYAEYFWVSGGV